ncbi:PIN-like domain-containing protein [Chryseobacterium lactis]|uniref:PIN-like domain-containing protein n=1 Tax=Chryseobacterium lactis TaxID=1241981 RepID=UPI003907F546
MKNNYLFSDIKDIVNKGKLRFEISSGYMDRKDKEQIQIIGKLIVWKEILAYSKQQSNNVIFVCNDLKVDSYVKILGAN